MRNFKVLVATGLMVMALGTAVGCGTKMASSSASSNVATQAVVQSVNENQTESAKVAPTETATVTQKKTTAKEINADKSATIIDSAKTQLSKAFCAGGKTPETGFDASGYTMWCYSQAGIKLSPTVTAQYAAGEKIELKDAKAGDLVFFKDSSVNNNEVNNVAIYLGNGQAIGAGGKVVGTFNITSGYYAEHYVGVVRIPGLNK